MTSWDVPEGMAGNARLLRIRPGNVTDDPQGCPMRRAVAIRPLLVPLEPAPRMSGGRAPSAMGAVGKVLDLVEFDDLGTAAAHSRWLDQAGRSAPPMLVEWVRQAVANYLSAAAALPDEGLAAVSRDWARSRQLPDSDGQLVHEELVTGRRYERLGLRELRLLRMGSVNGRAIDESEVAVAAGVLAVGGPVLNSVWDKKELLIGPGQRPGRIRVVEIGCADGSHRVVFEGSPDEARDRYHRFEEDRLSGLVNARQRRPGSGCGDCPLIARCPEVAVRPGLLGLDGRGRPRRSWSVSTGRSFKTCPARVHAEKMFLPRDRDAEDGDGAWRGRVVHDWLERLHRRLPTRACAATDAPATPDDLGAGASESRQDQARLGVQMISDHSLTCALAGLPDDAAVHPERSIVVYDPVAEVVVVAKADLLYRIDDVWVLRETKTVGVMDESNLLRQYSQLALAAVLGAAGVFPGGSADVRVELERLGRSGPVLTEIDVADPDLVADARLVLSEDITAWHNDRLLAATPGAACKSCAFRRWCPERAA